MLSKLTGGKLYDPANGINGDTRDIYIRDGKIVDPPADSEIVHRTYSLDGKIVMAGAIDMHTHIGGGKVNIARTMLPEDQRGSARPKTDLTRSGGGHAIPSTLAAGYRYAEMGYTSCFEPAVLPANARQAHMEMADTPMIDTGGYAMLGNDDLLLQLISEGAEQQTLNDYVAWTLHAAQCIGIKVVNPGGINAFKFNQRALDVDDSHPHYRITPRDIVRTLSRALSELGVPHPLHVHASNLGVPGNYLSTLATMEAAEGFPIHLTHIQFHSYGTEGDQKFSSCAAEIAEAVNNQSNISIDVGQVMFGQTVTISGDTMAQHANHNHAHPNKWTCMDIECDAGCGVVPFRYRDKNFVNALQWAIGLELFLMVDDPWRIFLTTDHPNGAPFTSYPHLIRLLMDRGFRNDLMGQIHPEASAATHLGSLEREYSLYEIAIMTRAAPARILGLSDRGHLAPGALADIAVYHQHENPERMFERPMLVFKQGEVVVEEGRITQPVKGATQVVRPEYDKRIEKLIERRFERYHSIGLHNFVISDDEMAEGIGSQVNIHACKGSRT
ncbi:MAG: formylmethanofuran dehydrogenase subunit A [Candidatus Thiodiazotropha taylori]|nr:formylmethanofuran dehydrogenase subunit A [Candidatus Thiodiazotropha sp. (ex Codakia orbicularis)]MCG7882869.1 formylmethanofuran dehydrogenase subunit A [Candidatus Thiodiazotropha taylori]MCW4226846.1 formylmethanofuran dehydrogenase subunit A [Candidatus Thiodiazotropha endolucinida]MCG7888409.1 formylmethanofuran dehydrogenase subunit A [Candidatus Thiodiazotropha taylori]MCG7891857.1 formylmethanofuran dehydrogenase subunit A [Candidatus Thiodiazotropha taylori]